MTASIFRRFERWGLIGTAWLTDGCSYRGEGRRQEEDGENSVFQKVNCTCIPSLAPPPPPVLFAEVLFWAVFSFVVLLLPSSLNFLGCSFCFTQSIYFLTDTRVSLSYIIMNISLCSSTTCSIASSTNVSNSTELNFALRLRPLCSQ